MLAGLDHPENGDMPVAWAKAHGKGRVVYCSLGHDYPAYIDEGLRERLRGGVRWAAGGPASE